MPRSSSRRASPAAILCSRSAILFPRSSKEDWALVYRAAASFASRRASSARCFMSARGSGAGCAPAEDAANGIATAVKTATARRTRTNRPELAHSHRGRTLVSTVRRPQWPASDQEVFGIPGRGRTLAGPGDDDDRTGFFAPRPPEEERCPSTRCPTCLTTTRRSSRTTPPRSSSCTTTSTTRRT